MINGTSAMPRVRALCCECGTLRTTTEKGILLAESFEDDPAQGRCLILRVCATCRAKTVHAFLRDLPTEAWCRDIAELPRLARQEAVKQQAHLDRSTTL